MTFCSRSMYWNRIILFFSLRLKSTISNVNNVGQSSVDNIYSFWIVMVANVYKRLKNSFQMKIYVEPLCNECIHVDSPKQFTILRRKIKLNNLANILPLYWTALLSWWRGVFSKKSANRNNFISKKHSQ